MVLLNPQRDSCLSIPGPSRPILTSIIFVAVCILFTIFFVSFGQWMRRIIATIVSGGVIVSSFWWGRSGARTTLSCCTCLFLSRFSFVSPPPGPSPCFLNVFHTLRAAVAVFAFPCSCPIFLEVSDLPMIRFVDCAWLSKYVLPFLYLVQGWMVE